MISRAQPDPDTTLTLRRTFNAERARVYRAWTDPSALSQWFCPLGMEVALAEVDLREGGRYRIGMRSPEGEIYITSGVYREISPPGRLVYTWCWEQSEGETSREAPAETLVTVEFHEHQDGTEVVLTHELFPSAESRDRHGQGWEGCLEHLEQALPALG